MFSVKICNYCMNNWKSNWNAGDICGFFEAFIPSDNKCPYCHNELQDINIPYDELRIIKTISCNISFLQAMIKLKETDPIEYQLKMSQFRTQVQQQESIQKQQSEQSEVHCPYCNSTNVKKITGTERVASVAMLGIFSKKINKSFKCSSCGGTF